MSVFQAKIPPLLSHGNTMELQWRRVIPPWQALLYILAHSPLNISQSLLKETTYVGLTMGTILLWVLRSHFSSLVSNCIDISCSCILHDHVVGYCNSSVCWCHPQLWWGCFKVKCVICTAMNTVIWHNENLDNESMYSQYTHLCLYY